MERCLKVKEAAAEQHVVPRACTCMDRTRRLRLHCAVGAEELSWEMGLDEKLRAEEAGVQEVHCLWAVMEGAQAKLLVAMAGERRELKVFLLQEAEEGLDLDLAEVVGSMGRERL